MQFNLTRKEVEAIARIESYTVNNVEKVIRLSMILDDLNTLPEFRGNFLLKGGTAINLVAFEKLPRLSVDLDLDLAHNLSKEEMLSMREDINIRLKEYCQSNGYVMDYRTSYALDSISLKYETVSGSKDKIKLDMNYLNRCHILDPVTSEIPFPLGCLTGRMMTVAHVPTIELFAGKIKAFYERCKPRDIYDIYSLSVSGMLMSDEERTLLRKCIVFYSTLGNEDNPEILKRDIRRILDMPFMDIKTQLLPMLHTHMGKYEKEKIDTAVIRYLTDLMQLDSSDQEYISEFFKGNFKPELLFPNAIAEKLSCHPVALKTQMNIKGQLEE